jgi:hypothetical protein
MIRESECVSPRNTFLIYADDDQGLSKCLPEIDQRCIFYKIQTIIFIFPRNHTSDDVIEGACIIALYDQIFIYII